MTDWRSASADMRFLGIDEYLADLNVLVDHVGGLVDLIGLCQGGWLSLVYAGRFPAKVRKLVMAGAPVDIAARHSPLSAIAEATPLAMFQSLVNLGDGRVLGRNLAKFWGNDADANGIREISADASADRLAGIHAARSDLQDLEFLDDRHSREHIISKLSRNCTSGTNSPTEASSPSGKRSTSRGCGFQCIFLPGAPTKWLPRNNCLQWSGW